VSITKALTPTETYIHSSLVWH